MDERFDNLETSHPSPAALVNGGLDPSFLAQTYTNSRTSRNSKQPQNLTIRSRQRAISYDQRTSRCTRSRRLGRTSKKLRIAITRAAREAPRNQSCAMPKRTREEWVSASDIVGTGIDEVGVVIERVEEGWGVGCGGYLPIGQTDKGRGWRDSSYEI